ncbi:MAG TPA: hypothetical protein VM328_09885, partial [Fimbriimonadaceae bacterium]|nr:hypothetical protein [Fimbriimonadaceae bacterium]
MESRQRIELEFDCAPLGGDYRRTERWRGQSVIVDEYLGKAARTIPQNIDIPADTLGLVFNVKGTVLMRQEANNRWLVAPTRSLAFVRGPVRLISLIARGDHHAYVCTWQGWATPFLNTWLNQRLQAASVQRQRMLSCKPIDPMFVQAFDRFEHVLTGADEILEPLVLSVLYEVVPRLVIGRDEIQLAPLPP